VPLPDPSKPLEVVLVDDPRLSPTMDRAAYMTSRDPALIVDADPSCRAVRFTLHPIARRHLLAIDAQTESPSRRHYLAAMASIRAVRLPGGDLREPTDLQTIATPRDGEPWKAAGEAWEDYLASVLRKEHLYTLGRLASERAGIAPGDLLGPLV
jgi:hypothetical protein